MCKGVFKPNELMVVLPPRRQIYLGVNSFVNEFRQGLAMEE